MSARTNGRLVASQYLDDGRYGLLTADNQILVGVASNLSASDAHRLAACWNACNGAPIEQIESIAEDGGLVAFVESLKNHLSDFYSSQDVVATALVEFCDQMKRQNGLNENIAKNAAMVLTNRSSDFLHQQLVTRQPTSAMDLALLAVAAADADGTVLTISQAPRLPLAMGNYETIVSVRESGAIYRLRLAAQTADSALKGGAE